MNYPEYPELPGNTRNTRNYPRVKKIPENTRSYFSILLPDPNPIRYPVFFPIPDPTRPDIEKPYPLGTVLGPPGDSLEPVQGGPAALQWGLGQTWTLLLTQRGVWEALEVVA